MSILSYTKDYIIERGYDYCISDKVKKYVQLNDFEFEGEVEGSLSFPYHTKINIKEPLKSTCSCPYADGKRICKHMIALYFQIFPLECEEYESTYFNDDYYDEEDNDFYDSHQENHLFFDLILDSFLHKQSKEDLIKILSEELERDQNRTYNKYLKISYDEYIKNDSHLSFIDDLYNRIQRQKRMTSFYYFEDIILLSTKDKQQIINLYQKEEYRKYIDTILFDEELSIYSDYQWVANYLKKHKTKEEINILKERLEDYLSILKYRNIRSTFLKSNVCIVIEILSDYNEKEVALSLYDYSKYEEYVEYIIGKSKNVFELFNNFKEIIEKRSKHYNAYISDVLQKFMILTEYDQEMSIYYYLYNFLYSNHKYQNLLQLNRYFNEEELINFIENKTNHPFCLMELYRYFHKVDELWDLFKRNPHMKYSIENCIDVLKDKYHDELYEHYIHQFYKTLEEGKKREVYQKACIHLHMISKLTDGKRLIQEIIDDLNHSSFAKCSALFDEIRKVNIRSKNDER